MRCFALEQYGLGDCAPRADLPVRPSGHWVNYHGNFDMNLVYLSTFGFHVIGKFHFVSHWLLEMLTSYHESESRFNHLNEPLCAHGI